MSRTKFTCGCCGRELGLGEMVSTDGVLWRCKECSIKHNEEYCNKDTKIADLEAKLAEKEKEIEQLKKFDDLNKTFFALFRTAFREPNKVDDLFNTLKTMQEKQDQAKTEFAIQQLERVKERYPRKTTMWSSDDTEDGFEYVSDFIDQIIKELEGECGS